MAGMAPQAAETPAEPAADEVEDDDETPNVSPEEQESYDSFVKAGFALMYEGGEVRPGLVKLLDDDPADLMAVLENVDDLQEFNHVVAAAATAVIIVLEVVRRAGDQKPDGDIILHAGKAILEDCIEISEKVGGRKFTEDEANRAMLMAADLYRETAASQGMVNEDELKAEFEEIVTADKEGRLGEVVPQLQQINELAAADAAEAEAEGVEE